MRSYIASFCFWPLLQTFKSNQYIYLNWVHYLYLFSWLILQELLSSNEWYNILQLYTYIMTRHILMNKTNIFTFDWAYKVIIRNQCTCIVLIIISDTCRSTFLSYIYISYRKMILKDIFNKKVSQSSIF